ncbi:hypothetical protein K402DRAFT_452163 [Aulographum hederae CBS 113979]|uniref:DNA replication regulator Sld3 C-terminal domain-containing protein n=1 Tax=Aulographum hederae CBS 113979 TaxID=1176131 RepID=A0A6G1H8Q5_9PEZI|nr:hypothetical protein K402DRAFT_452163 [Aulographum hederae CBS 113979]
MPDSLTTNITPSAPSGTDSHAEPEPETLLPSKKRKRDSTETPKINKQPIIIRPHPQSLYDKPITLRSIRTIPRAHLPLSYLDPTAVSTVLPSFRLFSARIECLETTRTTTDAADVDTGSEIVVARVDAEKSIVAIERVARHVYAVCKLGHWVKAKDLDFRAEASSLLPVAAKSEENENAKWWESAALPDSSLGIEKNLTKRPCISMPPPHRIASKALPSAPTDTSTTPYEPTVEAHGLVVDGPQLQNAPPNAEQAFENLITQYLDTLYLSKTSLAFFAKGPLSRARAACNPDTGSSFSLLELAEFLRTMLIPLRALDSKHRERIVEIAKDARAGTFSDESPAAKRKLKKNKLRLKVKKDGMYNIEEDYVKKWLESDEQGYTGAYGENVEARMKRRAADLRVREMFAQLTIALEILAVEASPAFKDHTSTSSENRSNEQLKDASEPTPKKKKAKKQQNLLVLLDLLADRLCIWQSIEQGDLVSSEAKSGKAGTAANGQDSGNNDILRSFCIEVVVPFYTSRLPEQTALVNKKLGGPTAPSPAKHTRPENPQKPAEDTSGLSAAKKPRRPLQRVSTEIPNQKSHKPPSLNRSATDSQVIPGLKREQSEKPLSSIPLLDTSRPNSAHSRSMSHLKHLSRREMDLSAMTAATEAKLKKKAAIEAELRNAIGTLRKPNRGGAIMDYVNSVPFPGAKIRRKAPLSAAAERERKKNDVQVSATPKRVDRTRSLEYGNLANPHHDLFAFDHEGEMVPSSSSHVSVVPASTMPGRFHAVPSTVSRDFAFSVENSAIKSSRGNNIAGVQETPSRGLVGRNTPSFFPSSSADVEKSGVPNPPPFGQQKTSASETSRKLLFQQPAGAGLARDTVFKTPSKPVSQRKAEMKNSISKFTSTPKASIRLRKSTDADVGTERGGAAVPSTPMRKRKSVNIGMSTEVDISEEVPAALTAEDDGDDDGDKIAIHSTPRKENRVNATTFNLRTNLRSSLPPPASFSKIATPAMISAANEDEAGDGTDIYKALGWDDEDELA